MAKQENEALFEESSQGAVSAVTALVLVVSLVLVFGGILLLSYAFDPSLTGAVAFWMFFGGLLAATLGFVIPFNLLPSSKK